MAGGKVVKIPTNHDDKIYAFYRQSETDRVVVVLNLSNDAQEFTLEGIGFTGTHMEIFSHEPADLKSGMRVTLPPWAYRVLTN